MDSPLPDAWTTIAEKPREVDAIEWRELPGVGLGAADARKLVTKGVILMASRYTDDHVELVVRPVIQPRSLASTAGG